MSKVEGSIETRRVLAGAAALAYAVALPVLATSGILLWRRYCEGFGCVGKGVAWFAWAMGFIAALAIGCVARRSYRGIGYGNLRYLLLLQAAAGVSLVAYWVAWRAT